LYRDQILEQLQKVMDDPFENEDDDEDNPLRRIQD